ncbi:MAG TPA: hypothetical protein VKI44_13825 [Acetobacteraceae bacterium]|nr:hypothetical protein [Acetobacteraceae bacterium]
MQPPSRRAGCSRSATPWERCYWSRAAQRTQRWRIARTSAVGALPRAQIHPDNLWVPRRLLDCLGRRGETAEAALIRQRARFAAARADVPVSCFCARG